MLLWLPRQTQILPSSLVLSEHQVPVPEVLHCSEDVLAKKIDKAWENFNKRHIIRKPNKIVPAFEQQGYFDRLCQ